MVFDAAIGVDSCQLLAVVYERDKAHLQGFTCFRDFHF